MNFTTGKTSFEPEHFANLFKEYNAPEQIKKIYSFHKNGDLASDRLISFFNDVELNGYATPKLSYGADSDQILKIFNEFKSDLVDFLSMNNEEGIAKKIEKIYVSFNEDYQYVAKQRNRNDIFHPELFDIMSDIFRETYTCEFMIGSALREALYQLTTDYDVTRYLFSPITRFPHSFGNGYRFWLANGVYCFYDDHVEISILE